MDFVQSLKSFAYRVWRSFVFRLVLIFVGIILIFPPLSFAGVWFLCRGVSVPEPTTGLMPETQKVLIDKEISSPEYLKRGEEQTYLTFPEWYIVYAADEYAEFIAGKNPSGFPYFKSVSQYWRSYCSAHSFTRDKYLVNLEYHTVLVVIGASHTVENVLKGIYENTVGRIAELVQFGRVVDEDSYAASVAKEYGEFLHTIPWYEFPFFEKLTGLWTGTELYDWNMVRKIERKFILSLEYGAKSLYGSLIKSATKAVLGDADLEIHAILEGFAPDAQEFPEVRLVKNFGEKYAHVVLPRYEAFTKLVPKLVEDGVRFVDIAGNDEILATIKLSKDMQYESRFGRILFSNEVLSKPELLRLGINVPVYNLSDFIFELKEKKINLEHIYDY